MQSRSLVAVLKEKAQAEIITLIQLELNVRSEGFLSLIPQTQVMDFKTFNIDSRE